MSNRIFIISNIPGGGSIKYITDLTNHYPNIHVIKNKKELFFQRFSSNDTLMIQQLFFTGIVPQHLIELKKKYSFKMIICIHDFCWFHSTKYESIYLDPINIVSNSVKELFSLADFVIHPSYFTKNIYEIIPHRAIVQPHNDIILHSNTKKVPLIEDKIIIGIPHAFSDYKGKENIEFLMKYKEYKGYPIQFSIVDYNTPKYTEDNWVEFYNKVHCLLHLNKWGETYCYTLTKSINSGLPILYNNVGAFKERIPSAEHYFKVIENESEYYDRTKLTKTFETMLDYIIEKNGKYIYCYFNTTVHYHDLYDSLFEPRMPVTILLTSTVNVNKNKECIYQIDREERIQNYLKSIQHWLQYTKINIVLVENSGYDFPELKKIKDQYNYKFEYITYDETKYKNTYENKSKGISELFAINYAYKNSIHLNKSLFIIKITARYFIPELESYLHSLYLPEYECLVQHDTDRCEMVGARNDHFQKVFRFNTEYGHIESYYKTITSSLKKLKCKKFFIEPTQRGGDSEIFNTI
jgi:hypothetical protein